MLAPHFPPAHTQADTHLIDGVGFCSVSHVVLPSYSRLLFPSFRHWCCLLGITFIYLLNSFPCLHDAYKTNEQTCVSLRTPGFLEFSLISLGQM